MDESNELIAPLKSVGLTDFEVAGVLERVEGPDGILLYGSRARGDEVLSSDIDLLMLVSSHVPTFKVGRASVSCYTPNQLRTASRTLFGTHLRRDGQVVWSGSGQLGSILNDLEPVNPVELLETVHRYSTVLNVSAAEREQNFPGLVRLARYLLRSALYALSFLEGRPSFSVREIGKHHSDPGLEVLLASDPAVTGPPSLLLLEDLVARLIAVVGPLPRPSVDSLPAIAVEYWDSDRNLAALALRAATESGVELDYTELPKVLL